MVRHGSATPLRPGSNPGVASRKCCGLIKLGRGTFFVFRHLRPSYERIGNKRDMRFIRKTIRRLVIFILVVAAAAVTVNYKTRFFKDIDVYIPYIGEYSPETVALIGDWSDTVNEYISRIPSPAELVAMIRHTELPIDPDDVATNAYYSSDTMLNFYNAQNISVSVSGNELDVYGVTDNYAERYLVYRFLDRDGNVLDQFSDLCDSDGKFRKIMTIPDSAYQFTVFVGDAAYGEYTGKVCVSPVHDANSAQYTKDKSISRALKNTYDICCDETNIKSLADSIAASYETDYQKALALHDWVCRNIYYDKDSVSNSGINTAYYVATDVVNSRQAVCLGFSNLYAALCRAESIPCNVVTGFALGVTDNEISWTNENINETSPNHAWNEVYADGRWIIVDTTWDTQNIISGGVRTTGKNISHLYFDANLRFFSQNHKIIEYSK